MPPREREASDLASVRLTREAPQLAASDFLETFRTLE